MDACTPLMEGCDYGGPCSLIPLEGTKQRVPQHEGREDRLLPQAPPLLLHSVQRGAWRGGSGQGRVRMRAKQPEPCERVPLVSRRALFAACKGSVQWPDHALAWTCNHAVDEAPCSALTTERLAHEAVAAATWDSCCKLQPGRTFEASMAASAAAIQRRGSPSSQVEAATRHAPRLDGMWMELWCAGESAFHAMSCVAM